MSTYEHIDSEIYEDIITMLHVFFEYIKKEDISIDNYELSKSYFQTLVKNFNSKISYNLEFVNEITFILKFSSFNLNQQENTFNFFLFVIKYLFCFEIYSNLQIFSSIFLYDNLKKNYISQMNLPDTVFIDKYQTIQKTNNILYKTEMYELSTFLEKDEKNENKYNTRVLNQFKEMKLKWIPLFNELHLFFSDPDFYTFDESSNTKTDNGYINVSEGNANRKLYEAKAELERINKEIDSMFFKGSIDLIYMNYMIANKWKLLDIIEHKKDRYFFLPFKSTEKKAPYVYENKLYTEEIITKFFTAIKSKILKIIHNHEHQIYKGVFYIIKAVEEYNYVHNCIVNDEPIDADAYPFIYSLWNTQTMQEPDRKQSLESTKSYTLVQKDFKGNAPVSSTIVQGVSTIPIPNIIERKQLSESNKSYTLLQNSPVSSTIVQGVPIPTIPRNLKRKQPTMSDISSRTPSNIGEDDDSTSIEDDVTSEGKQSSLSSRSDSAATVLTAKQELDKNIEDNKILSRMIRKYLGNIKAIFNENYGANATIAQREFEKDINDILEIDLILNTEFDEWVDKLKNFDKGTNLGIREQLFELKHNLLDLQVKIIVRKQSRARKDPDMMQIIELLNKKVKLVKKLMNFTLEEEDQIFVPEENDPEKIQYRREFIVKHENGANRYEEETVKDKMKILFQ